ncbi:CDP-alcohol phosphatidyltransferase family protein [Tessaracoccus sp.]|uniref:CDP-alcohol phosphatidyltransferase family protein n=1 Tax=Tessaracoccus sp. TaxID=1971211 RepID=UPI0026198966|nr:CDP-alcohol phosphatidyltransferase family protein [Tessaracoccus sp.]
MPTLNRARVARAWAVHVLTMTGVVWACLAALALHEGQVAWMWLWLGIALLVDGIDGTLARKAEVKVYAPHFDGAVLDNIVDYLTWTFIPALFMYLHLPLGPPWLAATMLVLVCVSSVFCYCNTGLKTDDYYFMGFPAAWNIVAVVLWLTATGAAFNVTVVVALAVLTIAPLTFVHPFRVKRLMGYNVAATLCWTVTTAMLIVQRPDADPLVQAVWWGSGGWLMLVSVIRTVAELRRRSSGARARVPA